MRRIIAVLLVLASLLLTLSASAAYNIGAFETVTVEGEKVDQSMLADYRLTMLNVWGTYCKPCIAEMPDLGRIHEEYKDKGMQVVGLVSDAMLVENNMVVPNEEMAESIKSTVTELGAEYTHILPTMDLYMNLLRYVNAVPTTIFLDSEGNQVGYAYSGYRDYGEWKKIIDQTLKQIPGEV